MVSRKSTQLNTPRNLFEAEFIMLYIKKIFMNSGLLICLYISRRVCRVYSLVFLIFIVVPNSQINAGEISSHTFYSDVLNRDYAYVAYFPDDYEQGEKDYSVVYLLHGSYGNEKNWTESGDLKNILDQLISNGEIPPTVVIMPGSSGWWVDGHAERSDTAFIKDLMPHVEHKWKLASRRENRVIAGVSAGGYGAVNFALKYPHLFGAALAFSPASYNGLPPKTSSAWAQADFKNALGEFDQSLWHSLNYINYMNDYAKQNLRVPIYIMTGDHDWLDIAYHGSVLYLKLRALQAELVEFRVVDGSHEWPVWVEALPDALKYAFQFVESEVPNKKELNPFRRFFGTWTLKDDEFNYAASAENVETLAIPNHITNCEEVNTDKSILCIVNSPGLKGHIFWAYNDAKNVFSHLSHFGASRLGSGQGKILPNGDLEISVTFTDEPLNHYRLYQYRWVNEDEYTMISRQYDGEDELSGSWYGGTFVRKSLENK